MVISGIYQQHARPGRIACWTRSIVLWDAAPTAALVRRESLPAASISIVALKPRTIHMSTHAPDPMFAIKTILEEESLNSAAGHLRA